jgi:hypothetical protein
MVVTHSSSCDYNLCIIGIWIVCNGSYIRGLIIGTEITSNVNSWVWYFLLFLQVLFWLMNLPTIFNKGLKGDSFHNLRLYDQFIFYFTSISSQNITRGSVVINWSTQATAFEESSSVGLFFS